MTYKYEMWIERHLAVSGRSGEELTALCHVHNDTNPSLSINAASGLWLCRSCGAHGNISHLVAYFGGQPVEATLATLDAALERLTPQEPTRRRSVGWLAQWPMAPVAVDWLARRGLGPSDISRWHLGYDTADHSVTIPLWTLDGCGVLGVIRRRLPRQGEQRKPKYLYPAGFAIGRQLYGQASARMQLGEILVVCEGSLDCIALRRAGFAAVALLGSQMTHDQARLIRSLSAEVVVLALDNDKAGQKGVDRSRDLLRGEILFCPKQWSGHKDPGEMTDDELKKMVATSTPIL